MLVRSAFFLAIALPAATVAGQSTWPGESAGTFGLRLSKIIVTADDGPDFATLSAVPSGRFALSPTLTLEVELPLARGGGEVGFAARDESGIVFGNPYVGVELPFSGGVLQVGARPGISPTPDDEGELIAQLFAILSEFDRYEAFSPETSTLRVLARFGEIPPAGEFAQVRIGATLVKPSEGDFDMLADYGGRIGHHSGTLLVHAGLLGRAILTSDGGSFAERTIHMLAGGVAGTSGRVRPQAEARYYLDEGFDDARLVVSLGLTVVP